MTVTEYQDDRSPNQEVVEIKDADKHDIPEEKKHAATRGGTPKGRYAFNGRIENLNHVDPATSLRKGAKMSQI